MTDTQDLKALQGFIEESWDSLQNIESAFISLEKDPADLDIINTIFRPVHSLKGNSGFFGLVGINKFAHRMENLLDYIRKGELVVDRNIIDTLLGGIDFLRSMLERVKEDSTDVILRPEEEEFLKERVDIIRPREAVGSRQSVLDLAGLLEEAVAAGIDLQQNSLTSKVLDTIEKNNTDIRRLIEELKASRTYADFRPAACYRYQGRDCTSLMRPFCEVMIALSGHAPLAGELIKEFTASLAAVGQVLQAEQGAAQSLDQLLTMANFLDDSLMVANSDFINTTCGHIRDILNRFETDGAEQEDLKLGEILVGQKVISPKDLSEALNKQLKVGEILVKEGAISEEQLKKALNDQNRQRAAQSKGTAESAKTIRIDQAMLDAFANSVGELFVNVDSFSFLMKQLEKSELSSDLSTRFGNTITALEERVNKLQADIMQIRRVPVKGLFQRFQRVVRELAAKLGKEIDFRIVGEDTVIDKDLLEKIENPLVHLLRNAVDHGLETPEERSAAAKAVQGVLELKAGVDNEYVRLSISDDGRGIDPLKMKAAAIRKGFMQSDEVEKLTDRELVNLIFRAGFSTADKVSDVSGRGVGMDVVQNALKETNGSVALDSVVGKGTTVNVTIPLTKTLITKDALIIEAGGQMFAIPSEVITITVYAESGLVNLLSGEQGYSYMGNVLQVVDINRFFALPAPATRDDDGQVLIVCHDQQVALLVDRMFNHQKIVVKAFTSFNKQLFDVPGIGGYTILGNEDVVLIMDVPAIAERSAAIVQV